MLGLFPGAKKTFRGVLKARFNRMIFKMANLQHTPSPASIIADYFSGKGHISPVLSEMNFKSYLVK